MSRHRSAFLLAGAMVLPGCVAMPAAGGSAAVAGALQLGGQPLPALRVCAQPLGPGAARCVATPAGAVAYRIDGLAPGRYHLLGWSRDGDIRLLAHARAIRCIRAPCPADTLIEVAVPAGAMVAGVDLRTAYLEVPAGWPTEPPP